MPESIIALLTVAAAVFGTGWIVSRVLAERVNALDEKVNAIRDVIEQGTREHEDFRQSIKETNKRFDLLLMHLLSDKYGSATPPPPPSSAL